MDQSELVNVNISGGVPGLSSSEDYILETLAEIVPVFWLHVADNPQQGLVATRLAYWCETGDVPADVCVESIVPSESGAELFAILDFFPHSSVVQLNVNRMFWLDKNRVHGETISGLAVGTQTAYPLQALSYLELDEGLIGIPDWRQFLLYSRMPQEGVGALIPLNQSAVSLAVVDPHTIMLDYDPRLDEISLAVPLDERAERLKCLSILNIQQEPFLVRVNMLGPVVYDMVTGAGCQVILSQSHYPVDYRLGDSQS